LANAKKLFERTQGLQRSQYDESWEDAQRRMGWRPGGWSLDRDQGAYGEALEANSDDFSGRGLLRSGMYAKAMQNIQNEFTDRLNTLNQGQRQHRETQDVAEEGFLMDQARTDRDALEMAVNRIAEKYNIALSQVPKGKTSSITREKA